MKNNISFIFWNINQKPRISEIVNLSKVYEVNNIVLAESQLIPTKLIKALGTDWFYYEDNCEKLQWYSTYNANDFKFIESTHRYSIRHFTMEKKRSLLFVGLHFPSKVNFSETQQLSEAIELNWLIRYYERKLRCENTIVFGDFNMQPFDQGMVNHAGFNAVMTKEIALKKGRKVQFKSYPYFFNPMWQFFGKKTSGTHYYNNDYHWQMFDQVLLRPKEISTFGGVEIITTDKQTQFLTKNGIIKKTISDHLPIFFTLKI